MATITATWTENVEVGVQVAVADSTTATKDIDLDAGGYDLVAAVVERNSGGADEVLINVYSSWDSGTTFDTSPLFATRMTGTATQRITLPIGDVPYIRVEFDNQSTSSANFRLYYSGRQWDST